MVSGKIFGLSLSPENIVRISPIFLTIAELSLEAPLPPFGAMGNIELEWKKIYPPLRFLTLSYLAKRQTDYLIGVPWWEWIEDWSESLREVYLHTGGTFGNMNRAKDGYLPLDRSLPFLNSVAAEDKTFQTIVKAKNISDPGSIKDLFQNNVRSIFGLEIYALLRHGFMLTKNYTGISHMWHVLHHVNENSVLGSRFLPPVFVRDGELQVGGWSSEFAENLIVRNIQVYGLHDAILGQKPQQYLEDTPNAISDRIRAHALQPVTDILGVDF